MDSSIESLELATQNWIYTIKKDDTLSDVEKAENIRKANELLRTIVKERRCEKCQNLCFNLKSCEFCIRKYLENEYSKWSSENDEIDKWILEFQTSFVRTDFILEWIPYNNLQDIQYISEGGSYFKIKAIWAEGRYTSWNFDLHELNRFGPHAVTLKHVNNKNNSDKKQWLQEINAHLSLSKPLSPVVRSYGLTKDDSNNYIIVTENIEKSLKKYLQENLNSLTWVQKYRILLNVLDSLGAVHKNQLIHGDLNSGIIRYSNSREIWLISDFSNCRPVKNPSNKCNGILPYVAPEMLQEQKEQMTQSSDIYSFAMIMWEVSTGYRPFENFQYSPELCVRIVNGSRPEIMRGTPKRYSEIMERCWNGDRSKRPSLEDVQNDIRDILNNYYKSNMSKEEQDEMKRCSNYQMVLIDKPYVPKVNQGISSIKIIEFDQISNEIIPEGVGRISYATMSSTKVAIKTIQINNKSKISLLSKVLQEKLSEWDHIYAHRNIVEFLGLGIKHKGDNKLFFVIPFATDGDLRNYIKNRKIKLPFDKKIEIAKDIASGIMVLHDNGIIHENLNPKNILIFNGIAKISNLPLPFGKEDFNNEDLYIESNDFKNNNLYVNTEIFDIIGYVDPNVFIKGPSDYVKAKSVDIYSLGTLLWEIMSEKVPHQENGIRELVKNITGGVKEADIPGISVEYKNLYTKCWDVNSDSRPTIKDVYNQLSNMK